MREDALRYKGMRPAVKSFQDSWALSDRLRWFKDLLQCFDSVIYYAHKDEPMSPEKRVHFIYRSGSSLWY